MNLSEALDAALPEMPKTSLSRSRPPCIDPQLVVREDVLDGEPIFAVLQREKGTFFRIPAFQWQLALLFDGIRSYDEIAAVYEELTGAPTAVEDVRLFAESMEEADFWYKTPQEKNLALSQKLMAQRGRRAGGGAKLNLAHISFSAWDPDRFLGTLDRAIGRYVYSPWCVLAVLLLFAFETTVFVSQWHVIAPDAALYYNFTHKSLLDLAEFWSLMLVIGAIHESAHGLTCKHFGGQVHGMGLMLIYLMPAFYCDVTEVWISATKVQRLATIIAGIWIEMVVCGLGMIVWLNTEAGQTLHEFAYQVILITGIAVILINLNPLIKLDGYFFLTETLGMPDLKERSTAFLSGWFQSRVLRLPVEMPVVPRRRAPFYIFYAFVSGAYSYIVLFFVIRFSYNITSNWLAEFALIPSGALAFVVFRSRLRSLRNVLVRLWQENFGAGHAWRPKRVGIAVAVALLLFLPLRRDRQDAFYTIEPSRSETVHAALPGRVDAVLVQEGEKVRAGQPLVRMTSLDAAAMHSAAGAQTGNARFDAYAAELQGQSIGTAAAQQKAALESVSLAHEAQASLVVAAPSDGTVVSHNPGMLVDEDVGSGQPLLELADAGPRMVRVYIPTAALERLKPGAEVEFILPDSFGVIRLPLAQPGGDAVSLAPGLVATQDYKGVKLPVFYSSRMTLPAMAGEPLFGIAGQAKIFGARRSIAERLFAVASNLVKAHVW